MKYKNKDEKIIKPEFVDLHLLFCYNHKVNVTENFLKLCLG